MDLREQSLLKNIKNTKRLNGFMEIKLFNLSQLISMIY